MSEIKHEWVAVDGYVGLYEVSRGGLVRRVATRDSLGRPRMPRLLKAARDRGYRRVTLSKGSRPKNVSIHSLVARAFVGPRPDGLVVNHKDGDKANNHAQNLEYITIGQNNRHAARMGFRATGEAHGMSRLTAKQVRAMCKEYDAGMSIGRITALTGMSARQVSRIVNRVSWNVA